MNGVSGLTEEEKMDAALILIGADIPGGDEQNDSNKKMACYRIKRLKQNGYH
ncbi:MAG TPA: hypothetical protein PKY89_00450 [Deltaproteobacteria bacterium]|nr:hypothetical protein [Deltaproteobacteria bacterium]